MATPEALELSGAIAIDTTAAESQSDAISEFEFDLDTSAMPVAWAITALAATLFALWIVSTLGRRVAQSFKVKIGLADDGAAYIGNYLLFLYQGIYVCALFIWAWSSAKAVLGHTAASHLFGGLAIGVGLALRDLFSSAMVYFVLKTSAPFVPGDLVLVRTGRFQQIIGFVRRVDFLHTKLDSVDVNAKRHDDHGVSGGYQYVQNTALSTNTIVVFKHTQNGFPRTAWEDYKRWRKAQMFETEMARPVALETPLAVPATNQPQFGFAYRPGAQKIHGKTAIRF